MSYPGNVLDRPLGRSVHETTASSAGDRQKAARDAWALLRKQAEEGDLPAPPPAPPVAPPPAPTPPPALKPLIPPQNAYFDPVIVTVYLPEEAVRLPPDVQARVFPIETTIVHAPPAPPPPPPAGSNLRPLTPPQNAYFDPNGPGGPTVYLPNVAASLSREVQARLIPIESKVSGSTPTPGTDLSRTDPVGWAQYQQQLGDASRKRRKEQRRATKAVLPPLGKGQNMYYQYDASGNFVRKYTPSQALSLPPDVAVHLKAVTDKPSFVEAVDSAVIRFGRYLVGADPPGQDPGYDPIDDLADDVEDVADDAANVAKGAESVGGKLFDTGEELLNELGDLFEYAPYLVLAVGAGALIYMVRPMFAGSGRSK